jgi:hypothetical protein
MVKNGKAASPVIAGCQKLRDNSHSRPSLLADLAQGWALHDYLTVNADVASGFRTQLRHAHGKMKPWPRFEMPPICSSGSLRS